MAEATPTSLKMVLRQKHLQTHGPFCREYDRIAKTIDPDLVGSWPSRAQFHRWLSGELKGLPYPHHCRVLEKMLPGYSAAELFVPYSPENAMTYESADAKSLLGISESRLSHPESGHVEWGFDKPTDIVRSYAAISTDEDISEETQQVGRRLTKLMKVHRLDDRELSQIAHLAGHIIDLDTRIDIEIERDGSVHLAYHYELLNMTERPITRLSRELWFEHTIGRLDIQPLRESNRHVAIQRRHDTPNLSKFACQLSPAIRPGESALVGYTCGGGKFVDAHYWRQGIARYTRRFTINLRHGNAGDLITCSAIEEHQDGSENSATEELQWDYEGDDVIITLTRDYLRPNQSITLRWEVTGERP